MASKKWKKRLVFLLLLIISIGGAGFAYIKINTYHPTKQAITASVAAEEDNHTLFFKGKEENPVLIFYQGAFVDNQSYSIWAQEVAAAGYSVYLLKQPLNLAVLGMNDAEKLIKKEKIDKYLVGGHSLGGVMASRFAHNHLEDEGFQGVFLLASYPDKKGSLAYSDKPVLSITGTEDGVLNKENYEEGKVYLPKNASYQVIQGGNHAGFGSYGQQKGDNPPEINNEEQQRELANMLIQWLSQNFKA
ncbi:alpha/beta hydrolase [Enterococcus sp. LJL128]|uniref:alpha/beta hydrolase n=1 Tax=Enterococcus sp. LJL51 TaxID=3416656 RepID=UPI003CF791D7